MAGVALNWEAATTELAAAFRRLSAVLLDSDFYLAGGTALALLEGHRTSVDLDLMSPSFDHAEDLIQLISDRGLDFETTSIAPRTLYLRVGGVQASLFSYRYPLIAPLVTARVDLLPLAAPDDIAAMKLAAIASRGSRKDFIDLWVLARRHRSLPEYLHAYATKFGSRDVGHVIRSLTYFEDAELEPLPRLLIPIDWERVKNDFLAWVKAEL